MTVPTLHGDSRARVDALVKNAVDLHTLPVLVFEADRLMRDPRTSAQQVADLLARDPVLSGRLLKLVNSPFYGFQKRIGNLTQAIVILGFQTVKNLMLTVTVIESFRGDADETFDYSAFWAHSVACAVASSELARLTRAPHTEEAYIAGLLHDVGKLLVAQHLPELSAEIHRRLGQGATETEIEREVLGFDHSDVGGMLALSWALPDSLAEAIRDHHSPRRDGRPVTPADVVQLADVLVSALGYGHPRGPLPAVSTGASERLGYDEQILSQWLTDITGSLFQAQEFFEIVGARPVTLKVTSRR